MTAVRKTFHLSVDILGALKRPIRELNYFTDDQGRKLSPHQARECLLDLLQQGHVKMQVGKCDGFDPFGKGCPGHVVEEERQT